jgi:hypothetical protein
MTRGQGRHGAMSGTGALPDLRRRVGVGPKDAPAAFGGLAGYAPGDPIRVIEAPLMAEAFHHLDHVLGQWLRRAPRSWPPR